MNRKQRTYNKNLNRLVNKTRKGLTSLLNEKDLNWGHVGDLNNVDGQLGELLAGFMYADLQEKYGQYFEYGAPDAGTRSTPVPEKVRIYNSRITAKLSDLEATIKRFCTEANPNGATFGTLANIQEHLQEIVEFLD